MPSPSRFATEPRIALPGSHREPVAQAEPDTSAPAIPGDITAKTATTKPRKEKPITVSVIVRRKKPLNAKLLGKPAGRLSRAAYKSAHGADPDAIKMVKTFARESGLEVAPAIIGLRTMQLTGTPSALATAFGATLKQATVDGVACRVREGSIMLPQQMVGPVVAVLGLDSRPQAIPHFRIAKALAVSTTYTPVQIAQLYGFPAGATAATQTIGLIELGGGFRTTDLNAYFKSLGLPVPTVTAVSVDGGKNTPGTANGADGEVMLDIEVSGAVAPGAKIAVYFAPNTDQGFIDAITTAVHDPVNKPNVISISWGGPESSWTGQAYTALDAACQSAAALGVTITVACGDNGSTDGGSGDNVDFPASSPHVLSCGGTQLNGSGTAITSEVVWNEVANNEGATGGGVSKLFALPAWQAKANVPASAASGGGRGLPDVAGDADPTTGYTVRVDGQTITIGGTSAVAPLWAGLIALSNEQNRNSAGFVNPLLYGAGAKKAFRDITQGNNGSFSAGPGWDACTGLGSPIGTGVVAVLGSSAPAKKKPKRPKKPV